MPTILLIPKASNQIWSALEPVKSSSLKGIILSPWFPLNEGSARDILLEIVTLSLLGVTQRESDPAPSSLWEKMPA